MINKITSLVLLIRTRRLGEAKGLSEERLSQVRAAGRGWAVGAGDLEAARSRIVLGQAVKARLTPAPDLIPLVETETLERRRSPSWGRGHMATPPRARPEARRP